MLWNHSHPCHVSGDESIRPKCSHWRLWRRFKNAETACQDRRRQINSQSENYLGRRHRHTLDGIVYCRDRARVWYGRGKGTAQHSYSRLPTTSSRYQSAFCHPSSGWTHARSKLNECYNLSFILPDRNLTHRIPTCSSFVAHECSPCRSQRTL